MKRKLNPKQTIEDILTVSEKLFVERGFEKTSTLDIMNVSGISKGTIFHHFKSKEDILIAVLKKHIDIAVESMQKCIADMKSYTAKEKIEYLLETDFNDPNKTTLSKMAISATSPNIIIADLKMSLNKIAPILTDLILEGVNDGSIQTEYPEECSQLFVMFFSIWCDPVAFECDYTCLKRRLKFIQHTLKLLGVDVVSDKYMSECVCFIETLMTNDIKS